MKNQINLHTSWANLFRSRRKYSGPAPIVHLKDYKIGFLPEDAGNNLMEGSTGDVDMEAAIRWAEDNGVKYYCIQQTYSKMGILKSLK